MEVRKTSLLISLLILIANNMHGQDLVKFNSLEIKGSKIDHISKDSLISVFGDGKLNYKEYKEEIALSSGDKLHYYWNDNVKLTFVFYSNQPYLQSLAIFSSEISFSINNELLSIGSELVKLKEQFPKSSEKYSERFEDMSEGVFFLNLLMEETDPYGNLIFEIKDNRISKIRIGLIE